MEAEVVAEAFIGILAEVEADSDQLRSGLPSREIFHPSIFEEKHIVFSPPTQNFLEREGPYLIL